MDNFIAARSQMGMSLAFHIIYATIGVSLPLMMTIAEWRWRSTGDPAYLILAKRWAKGTTILFTVGAVSGAVLSFELGLQQKITGDRDELARQSASLSGTPVHPLRLVTELQGILTPDTTLCLDMDSFHLWMARHLYSFRARQILISNGQQTLGVALPWAIAATLVRPAEKVLSISGDGGFLFSGMEIETAVRLQSNLVHMIWLDGTYDMVAVQEEQKYGRPSGTKFGPVDPIKYAEAFGAQGCMIQSPDQITSVLKQAFDTSGPVLVGVHGDYRDNHKLFQEVSDQSVH